MSVKRAALVSLGLTLLAGCWTPLKADQQNFDQRDPAAKEQRADALVAKLQQLRARVDASSRKVSLQEAIELSNGAPSVGFMRILTSSVSTTRNGSW